MLKILNILPALIIILLSANSYAGEWLKDKVNSKNGRYYLDIEALLDAPYEKVYALLTDYAHLKKLNPTMKESAIISTDPDKFIIRTITKNCVMMVCSKIINTQLVSEPEPGHIISITLPEQSNLKYGRMEWYITGKGNKTFVSMKGEIEPDFWVPPVFGPLAIKALIKSESDSSMKLIESISRNDQ